MKNYKIMLNEHWSDLNPVYAGEAVCSPNKTYYTAPHTMLLHYAVSGSGLLSTMGQTYHVGPGQAFLLPAGVRASFVAEDGDPWHLRWVGFAGTLTSQFSELPTVFDASEDTLASLQDLNALEYYPLMAYQLAGDLYRLYAQVAKPKEKPKDHIQKAIDYIEVNYMNSITIEQIAEHVGLNQYYLSRLFKKKVGHTLQHHILYIRLSEAKRYLSKGCCVKETAALCGFQDVANFSKLFKREFGKTPSAWWKWEKEHTVNPNKH